LLAVKDLSVEGRFDYLLIESSGISEPLPVAQTFTFADESGNTLSSFAHLDTMVTVVDGSTLIEFMEKGESLIDANLGVDENDTRDISNLLVDQIEFANVILLNKVDLLSQERLKEVERTIFSLNPNCKILHSEHGKIPLNEVLGTNSFDFTAAENAPGWSQILRGEEISETEEYGIQSLTFKSPKPFHPERLWQVMNSDLKGVIRSKGFFWLANKSSEIGTWSQAGGTVNFQVAGRWLASLPKDKWPKDRMIIKEVLEAWDSRFGDRKQVLVFIGQKEKYGGFNLQKLEERLNWALLNDEELKLPVKGWRKFNDPFPAVGA
jgi:G3E family GTPase